MGGKASHALAEAVASQSVDEVRELIGSWRAKRSDADLSALLSGEGEPNTPLDIAIQRNSLGMLRLLLASGANPDGGNSAGLTPLMTAAQVGSAACVAALMLCSAPERHRAAYAFADASTGHTALLWSDHATCRELLAGRRSALDFVALAELAEHAAAGDDLAVGEALAQGVRPVGIGKTSPLWAALAADQLDMADRLTRHGADPATELYGGTPLLVCACLGRPKECRVRFLLDRGASHVRDALEYARTAPGGDMNAAVVAMLQHALEAQRLRDEVSQASAHLDSLMPREMVEDAGT